MARIPIPWSRTLSIIYKMAENVSGINYVVGIKRGGVIPALLFASTLKISDIGFLWLMRYTDGKPPKAIGEMPELLEVELDDVRGKSILLVDDIARTGKTLRTAEKILLDKGARRVISAVIVLKANAIVKPDIHGIVMENCPLFPWEKT